MLRLTIIHLSASLFSYLPGSWHIAVLYHNITSQLGKPQFRGAYVHLPLMLLSCFIAIRSKGLGFIWLALLVVVAGFLIVITRFVFSYEQAFMGDLVRFWYAALFLFASANTLLLEGHIRVDVAYTHFKARTQSWVNIFGEIIKKDAFGHVRLDEINPGNWFADYFKSELKCDKVLVQKSVYFSRSGHPNKQDLKLIEKSCKYAVNSAMNNQSGVIGIRDETDKMDIIKFSEIKGGKPFDVHSTWFLELLKEINQCQQ